MRHRASTLAAALAGLAILGVSLPVGAYVERTRTGTTGEYIDAITDSPGLPGVTCRFEDNAGVAQDELDSIRIRRIFAHGPFAQDSVVGYRFIVNRQVAPFTGTFQTVYRSPLIRRSGNETVPAEFGARTWRVPEDTTARYRVNLILTWYAKGSSTQVIGRARGLMETYRQVLGPGQSYVLGQEGDAGWCVPNYHGL